MKASKSELKSLVIKVLVGALVATSAVGVSAPASNAATPVGTANASVATAAL